MNPNSTWQGNIETFQCLQETDSGFSRTGNIHILPRANSDPTLCLSFAKPTEGGTESGMLPGRYWLLFVMAQNSANQKTQCTQSAHFKPFAVSDQTLFNRMNVFNLVCKETRRGEIAFSHFTHTEEISSPIAFFLAEGRFFQESVEAQRYPSTNKIAFSVSILLKERKEGRKERGKGGDGRQDRRREGR